MQQAEARERKAKYEARRAEVEGISAGRFKRAIYRCGEMEREVEIVKISSGFARIAFGGCKLAVSPADLWEAKP